MDKAVYGIINRGKKRGMPPKGQISRSDRVRVRKDVPLSRLSRTLSAESAA